MTNSLTHVAVADAVAAYLNSQTWPDPIVAMSGNGYYVLYRIDLPNTEDSTCARQSPSLMLSPALFNTPDDPHRSSRSPTHRPARRIDRRHQGQGR